MRHLFATKVPIAARKLRSIKKPCATYKPLAPQQLSVCDIKADSEADSYASGYRLRAVLENRIFRPRWKDPGPKPIHAVAKYHLNSLCGKGDSQYGPRRASSSFITRSLCDMAEIVKDMQITGCRVHLTFRAFDALQCEVQADVHCGAGIA